MAYQVKVEQPRLGLQEVPGLVPAVLALRRVLRSVGAMEPRPKRGGAGGGRLLLWGPPGCGEMVAAEALAGELGAPIVAVRLRSPLADLDLLGAAARAGEFDQSVLVIDGLEALSTLGAEEALARRLLRQLFSLTDNAAAPRPGLWLVAHSAAPWDLPAKLLSPGRFDHAVFVGPPDLIARFAVLGEAFDAAGALAGNLSRIAAATEGYSCDDLFELARRAVGASLIDVNGPVEVTTLAMAQAVATTQSSTTAWLAAARDAARRCGREPLDYQPLWDYLRLHNLPAR